MPIINSRCLYYKRWYRPPNVPWNCKDTRLKEHYCVIHKAYCYNTTLCSDGVARSEDREVPDQPALEKAVVLYLKLCHPVQESTSSIMVTHFGNVPEERIVEALEAMMKQGKVAKKDDNVWTYVNSDKKTGH
jgi:hypothetical protein